MGVLETSAGSLDAGVGSREHLEDLNNAGMVVVAHSAWLSTRFTPRAASSPLRISPFERDTFDVSGLFAGLVAPVVLVAVISVSRASALS